LGPEDEQRVAGGNRLAESLWPVLTSAELVLISPHSDALPSKFVLKSL
jgi:hypothetical protein